MSQSLPTRRRFRFSLASLLVAVTLVAVIIGYYVNWIRQRRLALGPDGPFNGPIIEKDCAAPGLLWLFGERGHHQIFVVDDDVKHERLAQRLFPEAEVLLKSQWATPPPTD